MTSRRRLVAARLATAVGTLSLVVGLATTVGRSLIDVPLLASDTWAMITAFSDFGALAYGLALVCLVAAMLLRFWIGQLVAVIVAVPMATAHLTWIVPGYLPDGEAVASSARLNVVAENLLFGGADPAQVVATAATADVVVVVEMTSPAVARLAAAGINERFPHESGGPLPEGGAAGTRVYSRFPILSGERLDPALGASNWVVRLDVPGLGPLTLVAAHPTRPVPGASRWWAEQENLLARVPRERTIIAGDLNAVDSHPSVRRFIADGFRSADDLVGAGWQPTYPAQGRIPPLIAIDHILLSQDLTATAFRTIDIVDSDHRGVFASVALRG